ncbi:glycoside hydrolase family 5 protein [Microbacterium sp. SS28]|uniref:glycoside hydrolase family 5 protein n=1 Tax=Microbacterium sp. SS28 TaxID=2919948 RepID=UPI001FA980D2|nr:cellulase family glycosylhydrolase [Microbacterium sp. SS28]
MKPVRRALVAVSATAILVIAQAILDPTGLLALVGWSGAVPSLEAGIWPFAAYVVFVPVLLGVVAWVAVRAGDRFWTLVPGIVLAVLLAQAAACFVMTWNLGVSAWAAGYVTAKAVPAALIVAAATRLLGGRSVRERHARGAVWIPAIVFAGLAPLLSGLWWTSVAYAPGVPAPASHRDPISMILGMLVLAGATVLCLRWMRPRVRGILGGWLAAVAAGAGLGLVQAIVGFAFDRGATGELWPLMNAYVAVADGASFGACLGWIVGVTAVVADRATSPRAAQALRLAAALVVVAATAAAVILPSSTAAASSGAAQPAPPAGYLRADGGIITDGEGDQVLLRGVNVNQLVDFFQPAANLPATRPLTEDDFAGIAEQGFNVVRLGLSWSALEPEPGTIDEAYLEKIQDAVGWAKKHDIYIVLDMHQDGWWAGNTTAGTVCRPGTDPMWGYDGAPAWATLTDGAPRCSFTGRDISPAGDRAFQNFYFDTDGVQSALVDTWGKLAAVFSDEPTVAGYDLLNEPGFGETAPVTTSHLLGRFYGRAIDAIRAADAPQIVFIEPSIFWSGLGFDSGPTPGFTDDDNLVYSPHLYAESITMDRSLGLPPIVGIEGQFELASRAADAYGMPLWSGEYGYWGDDADRVARLTRYAAAEDAHILGSAYWVWKQACGDPQGFSTDISDALQREECATGSAAAPRDDLLAILSRAYPRSAPGALTSLKADGARVELAGTTEDEGCGLEVWVPGSAAPEIDSSGVTALKTAQVAGGWLVTGCAEGDYSLSTEG